MQRTVLLCLCALLLVEQAEPNPAAVWFFRIAVARGVQYLYKNSYYARYLCSLILFSYYCITIFTLAAMYAMLRFTSNVRLTLMESGWAEAKPNKPLTFTSRQWPVLHVYDLERKLVTVKYTNGVRENEKFPVWGSANIAPSTNSDRLVRLMSFFVSFLH